MRLLNSDKDFLTIKDASGRAYELKIENTWIPIEVTAKFSRELLKSDVQFRQILNSGILRLISPEEAEQLLDTPEAQEEYEKLFKSKHAKGNIIASSGVTIQNADSGHTLTANPKVISMVVRCQEKTLTGSDAVSQLRRLARNLTKSDWTYLISNLNMLPEFNNVTKYCQEELANI